MIKQILDWLIELKVGCVGKLWLTGGAFLAIGVGCDVGLRGGYSTFGIVLLLYAGVRGMKEYLDG